MKHRLLAFLMIISFAFGMAQQEASAGPIKSAKCVFEGGTEHFFDDGKLTYSVSRVKDKFELTFDRLDAKDGKGRIVGNNGSGDVIVTNGDYVINILEFTPVGNMNITTIDTMNINHGVKAPSVTSRHVSSGSALLPSQRVGHCQVFTI